MKLASAPWSTIKLTSTVPLANEALNIDDCGKVGM